MSFPTNISTSPYVCLSTNACFCRVCVFMLSGLSAKLTVSKLRLLNFWIFLPKNHEYLNRFKYLFLHNMFISFCRSLWERLDRLETADWGGWNELLLIRYHLIPLQKPKGRFPSCCRLYCLACPVNIAKCIILRKLCKTVLCRTLH